MFLIDDFLIGGLRFVLDKVATIADQELNSEDRLREQLLDAQLSNDLGDLSDEEFQAIEADILGRMREIREARGDDTAFVLGDDARVTGAEITFGGDDTDGEREP